MKNITLNTISEAIEDLKNGKIIIVVDDENRENKDNFLSAAELKYQEPAEVLCIVHDHRQVRIYLFF